jgi:hypothetical protein
LRSGAYGVRIKRWTKQYRAVTVSMPRWPRTGKGEGE